MLRKPSILLTLACLAAALPARAQYPAPPPATAPAQQFYIGVAVEGIPPLLCRQLKLLPDQGLTVQKVITHSPADNAKLQRDDILIAINSQPIKNLQQLTQASTPQMLNGKAEVESVQLEFIRDGEHHTITLTPALRPAELIVTGPPAHIDSSAQGKSYPGADGIIHQIGPGILLDTSRANAQTATSLKSVVVNNQTVVLTQEADAAGRIKYSLSTAGKTYRFEPNNLSQVPPDLRDLVKSLLPPSDATATTEPDPQSLQQLQDKLKQQAHEIETLKNQVNQLLKQPK